MNHRIAFVRGAAALLAGCASAPRVEVTPGLEAAFAMAPPETRIERPRGEVFDSALYFFADSPATIASADAESGAIYVAALGAGEIGRFADCGLSRAAAADGATARLAVTVTEAEDGDSLVTISTEFTQRRQGGVGPTTRRRCASRGLIEQALIAHLEGRDAPDLLIQTADAAR